MNTAFIFSGQGAQYFGMGQELYEKYKIVKDTFDEASNALKYDMAELCFTENEKLNVTEYTQPAILTVTTAIYRLLVEKGITPDVGAGLSLGEYSALVASGAISFKEAVVLVSKRGKYMAEAVPSGEGKMVAIMNAAPSLIERCCLEASKVGIVSPANYNTSVQIVIGGEEKAVDKACELLKEQGIKRMIPLNVSGPFHTALLEPASERLAKELEKITWKPMKFPVVSNTTAEFMQANEIDSLLTKQIMTAVRWEESIRFMIDQGVTQFVEVGPGKVLTGFMKKINKEVAISHVENEASLENTLERFSEQ